MFYTFKVLFLEVCSTFLANKKNLLESSVRNLLQNALCGYSCMYSLLPPALSWERCFWRHRQWLKIRGAGSWTPLPRKWWQRARSLNTSFPSVQPCRALPWCRLTTGPAWCFGDFPVSTLLQQSWNKIVSDCRELRGSCSFWRNKIVFYNILDFNRFYQGNLWTWELGQIAGSVFPTPPTKVLVFSKTPNLTSPLHLGKAEPCVTAWSIQPCLFM